MTDETYDSTEDTRAHQARVVALMAPIVKELTRRAARHDESKLGPEEKPIFDRFTPALRETEYGTDAYYRNLERMETALAHHYAVNRHHPQHFTNGVQDMSLVDLIEMLVDWRASQERNPNGSMERSLEVNALRFAIPEALLQVLTNTARYHGWLSAEPSE